MMTRVDRSFDEPTDFIPKRVAKNRNLYDEMKNTDLDKFDISSNAKVIGDNNSQIDASNNSTRTFAIDSLTSAPVETVAQLLMIVQNGRKPEFITTDKTKNTLINGKTIAEQTYIKARQVLNKICTDSMTDYQKALAIYNWIVVNNQYDFNTCDSAEGAPFNSDNLSKMSFYASGTLLNNLSVCKGIAQAFGLMGTFEGPFPFIDISAYAEINTSVDTYNERNNLYIVKNIN